MLSDSEILLVLGIEKVPDPLTVYLHVTDFHGELEVAVVVLVDAVKEFLTHLTEEILAKYFEQKRETTRSIILRKEEKTTRVGYVSSGKLII